MRVLVTGAGGLLGTAMHAALSSCRHEVTAAGRDSLDVTDGEAVQRLFDTLKPHAVVHCAAYTAVDAAESERDEAMRVNSQGTSNVALASRAADSFLIYPSTDYVFDGEKGSPYHPEDSTAPLNAYGESKLAGEEAVRREADRWLIVRTSWLYGSGGPNFVDSIVERGRSEKRLSVVADQTGSPTWTGSLARSIVELMEMAGGMPGNRDDAGGGWPEEPGLLLHVADRGRATWYELARAALARAGVSAEVKPVSQIEWAAPAPRPRFSVLDSSRAERILGRRMPRWQDSLARHMSGDSSDGGSSTEDS